MKIVLSYGICIATPWNPKYDAVGEFTIRERKTPEEIRKDKEFLKSVNSNKKVNPYKYTHESVFQVEGDTCYFLRGSWHVLKEVLDKEHEEYEVEESFDPEVMPEPDYEQLKGDTFRPGQVETLALLTTRRCGLICSTVGYGKSFLIKELCRVYPTLNILVVCAAGEVVRELYRSINEALPGQVGLLNMESANIEGKRIIVTTSKSMVKINPERVQLVLVDEAHNYGANASGNELLKFAFARKFGFTATPIRNQGDYKMFEAIFGPILQDVTFEEAKQAGSVTDIEYTMVPVGRKLPYLDKEMPDHLKTKLFYTSNPVRDQIIIETFKAIQKANPDVQILIMVQSIAHLIKLCEKLPECRWAHGERGSLDKYKEQKALHNTNVKKYEQNIKQLNWTKRAFETAEIKYAVSTFCWAQGINLSHLTVLIRADGATSGIPSLQVPGRLARLDKDKTVGYLIDIEDDFCEAAHVRAVKREKEYQKQGWKKISLIEVLQNLKKGSKCESS